MLQKHEIGVGVWVEYTPYPGRKEIGRIKWWNVKCSTWVFVVFKCDDNWEDFANYTAAMTNRDDLIMIEEPAGYVSDNTGHG